VEMRLYHADCHDSVSFLVRDFFDPISPFLLRYRRSLLSATEYDWDSDDVRRLLGSLLEWSPSHGVATNGGMEMIKSF